jgi:signal transduction histidine kinase
MRRRVPEETDGHGAPRPPTLPLLRAFASRRAFVLLILVGCCASIAYGRLGLGTTVVSTHFAYLPIVLTGMWWGRKSIWVALLLGTFILCLRPFVEIAEPIAADLARAFFFVAVAFCVGTVSEHAEASRRAEDESRKELESAQLRLVASERLASMGQLSAAVAHEINNPLGTILLYSHALLKQLGGEDPSHEDLEMIVSEATRCKDIVRGLLDFARQSRVSKSETDLSQLIQEVVSIMAPQAESASVRVIGDVEKGLPSMMIDAAQIKQMLVNLVQNGIDAIAESGEVTVRAHLCPEGDTVEINVSDTGCGIAREDIPKLFTPFFTTKELGQGTGLGLAIAYGVVKMHYGDIAVESEEGKGTTFTIRLPLGRKDEDEVVGGFARSAAGPMT